MTDTSIVDQRRSFWGGSIDAEREAIAAALADGITFADILTATQSVSEGTAGGSTNLLKRYNDAISDVAVKPVDVLVVGHSIVEGMYAPSNDLRWIELVRQQLQRKYNPTSVPGGEGYVAATHKTTAASVNGDPATAQRWTHNGITAGESSTSTLGYGLGQHHVILNNAADYAEITITTDRFWLFFTKNSSQRSAEILIDSVSVGTIDTYQAAAGTGIAVYDSGALSRGRKTVRVKTTAGSAGGAGDAAILNGIMVFDGDGGASVNTGAGVRLWDSSLSGARAETFYGPATTDLAGYWALTMPSIEPDLVVIQLGINEYHLLLAGDAAYTTTRLADDYSDLIDFINSQVTVDPSIVMVIDAGTAAVAGFDEAVWAEYVDALREVASAKNCVIVDLSAAVTFPTDTSETGYWADGAHVSTGGHALIAELVLNALNVERHAQTVRYGAKPALSGTIRLSNANSVSARNAGDTADYDGLKLNTSDIYEVATKFTVNPSTGSLGLSCTANPWFDPVVDGTIAQQRITQYGGTASQGVLFRTRRAKGTLAAPTKMLSGDQLWKLDVTGYDNSGAFATGAYIEIAATEDWNGTTNRGANLIFGVTPNASGGSPVEVFRFTSDTLTMAEAKNIALGTTTGTKFGTTTSQKIGFWNTTPIVQPTAVASPTGGITQDAECRTAVSSLLTRLRNLGIIAT